MSEVYFLDTSKGFNRVSHEVPIYNIKPIGVTGLPLEFIQSFLSPRFQRVVLNDQSSTSLHSSQLLLECLKGPF